MEYELKVTQQESQIILSALGELPLKVSLNIFAKIQTQLQEQDNKKAIPTESLKL